MQRDACWRVQEGVAAERVACPFIVLYSQLDDNDNDDHLSKSAGSLKAG